MVNLPDQNAANRRKRLLIIEGCAIAASLVVLAVLIFPSSAYNPSAWRGGCANTLKILGLSMKMYSMEDREGLFPLVSSQPGRLMFDAALMYPEYVPDATFMLCPIVNRDRGVGGELTPGIRPEYLIDDWSYIYLGYALTSEDDVERFAQAYREALSSGAGMRHDIVHPNDPDGKKTLFQFREGVEQALLSRLEISPDDAGAVSRAQLQIPLLIERLGNHDIKQGGKKISGANVLYLDGHVEFIEYPGKWPMTEKTIGILNELDALGSKPNR